MHKEKFILGVLCFLFCFFENSPAQKIERLALDSSSILNNQQKHSPKKAAIYSAILPGLGQAYNKKYWKIPIVYAGYAGLGYAFYFNQTNYIRFKKAYVARVDDDPATTDNFGSLYSADNLKTLQDYYHRYRDLTIIGMAVLYTLTIIDATVDAHLFEFDVSDNLSITIQPKQFISYNNPKSFLQQDVSLYLTF